MNAHSNARLTPLGRAELVKRIVELRQPVAEVAAGFGLSVRTARKWLARFRAEGTASLETRSSRPKRSPDGIHRLRVLRVLALRRKLPGFQIARLAKLSKYEGSRGCS
jgi:transposase